MNMAKTLGQIGYEAYCEHTGWKSLATGADLPRWADIRESIREAWEIAATAIAQSSK